MPEITSFQKELYNTYLLTSRRAIQKPFMCRKNFEDFETQNPEDYLALLKLERFFNQHPNINIKLFFNSPFLLYKDTKYFELKYYTTQAAIKCYLIYYKQLAEQSADSEDNIQFISASLLYLKKFCITNNIKLEDYLNFKKNLTFQWCQDLLKNNVSLYVLFGFENDGFSILNLLNNIPADEKELFLGDFVNKYENYKLRYLRSKLAKSFIKKGLEKLTYLIKTT